MSRAKRIIRVAGAQLGAIQKADGRDQVVRRMLALMERAHAAECDFIVYPELALTTFFPRWYHEDRAEADRWFERSMPNEATAVLFATARKYQMAMSFGYAELTEDGHHYNTSILTDKDANIVGRYRKTHLPGHAEYDPERAFQHLEKRYFEPGDLGFPVWRNLDGLFGMCICNDRRWPETYRVMGLQGVEMITLGFNTPGFNSQRPDESLDKRMFHHRLVIQSGAYQNSTWVVAIAKAGVEDGNHLMGGSMIVDPDGQIAAASSTEDDELITHDCDLDACKFGKDTQFNFSTHRRIEHYGCIATQTGVIEPD